MQVQTTSRHSIDSTSCARRTHVAWCRCDGARCVRTHWSRAPSAVSLETHFSAPSTASVACCEAQAIFRVLQSLPMVLDKLLVVRRAPQPSPFDRRARFAAELRAFSSCHHRLLQHEADEAEQTTRETVQRRWANAWTTLLAVANGSMYGDGNVGFVEHYCCDRT